MHGSKPIHPGLRQILLSLLLLCIAPVFTFGQINVNGHVIARDDKTPIPGVSVLEKGTSNGTVTDTEGRFSIEVSHSEATLEFSFIGFVPQEIELSGRRELNIMLKPDCIRDWFDAQRVYLQLQSGVVHTPFGGGISVSLPAYFGKGTLEGSVGYQTDFQETGILTSNATLKHFIFTCHYDLDAGWFYKTISSDGEPFVRTHSVESFHNFRKIGFIAGYGTLRSRDAETNSYKTFSAPVIGLRVRTPSFLRLEITGKVTLYRSRPEYSGMVIRRSRFIDVFATFYQFDTFAEVTLGIQTPFNYRLRTQKEK